ncbi:MAG: pilus assembly protein PilP [Desulfosalsimonas sp.]
MPGNSPQEQEEDIHVSEEVEIETQEQEEEAEQEQETEEQDENGRQSDESSSAEKQEGRQDDEADKAEEAEEQEDEENSSSSPEKELSELMLTEQEALMGSEERYYTRRGRVDPFEPFLRREEAERDEQEGEEIQRREPRTPLERIALSQLKLTAVLRIPGQEKAVAMVEDKGGKGYVVKEGTYIGENGGQVSDIIRDRIIIQEKYKDVFGKIAVREIEKKLQNQPGE